MYSMIPFGRMNTSWNDLFDDFERRMFPADRGELPAFRTDIRDEGDHFLLEADLPGFRKEDIDLHLQDGVLTITAKRQEEQEEKKEGKYLCRERRMGSCARAFDVSGIREEDITAAFAGRSCRACPLDASPDRKIFKKPQISSCKRERKGISLR